MTDLNKEPEGYVISTQEIKTVIKRYIYASWYLLYLVETMQNDLGLLPVAYRAKARACFYSDLSQYGWDLVKASTEKDLDLLANEDFYKIVDELELE